MQAFHHPVYGLQGYGSQGDPTTTADQERMKKWQETVNSPLFKLKMLTAPIAMGVGYYRTKSIWKAFLLGFVSFPYLIYVGYDTYKKK